MSLTASQLIWYGATDMDVLGDGTTIGGAIDMTKLIVWTDPTTVNALATTIKYVSTNSADNSQTITTTGRSSTGSIVTETITLNGTTVVTGTVTFQRVLEVAMSATAAGTVSIERSTDADVLATLPAGVKTVLRLFYNVSADVSTGSTRNYYDKAFLYNSSTTNAALGLTFQILTQPGGGASMQMAVESSVGGSGTCTNRQTAPSGVTGAGFGDGPTSIPGTDLAPTTGVGVYFNLTLTAGLAADVTTFVPEINCSTT